MTSSIAAAAIAAVASWSVIIRGRRGTEPRVLQARQGVGVRLVDEPAVEHAALGAGAVVKPDAGGADLDADRGQHLLRHAPHVGAADDR